MKKERRSVEGIVGAPKQAEVGAPIAKVIRKAGISEQTFCRGKKQYVGLKSGQVWDMKLTFPQVPHTDKYSSTRWLWGPGVMRSALGSTDAPGSMVDLDERIIAKSLTEPNRSDSTS